VLPVRFAALFAQNARCGTSPLFDDAALEDTSKLVLGVEPHRHAVPAVRSRNGALAVIAAALLNCSAWRMDCSGRPKRKSASF
jgi:hypothetical protein